MGLILPAFHSPIPKFLNPLIPQFSPHLPHFRLQFLNLPWQPVVLFHFAAQESDRDPSFFLQAAGGQLVEVFGLVSGVFEVSSLDDAFLRQGLDAEVDMPQGYSGLSGQFALADFGIVVDGFENMVMDGVVQRVPRARELFMAERVAFWMIWVKKSSRLL
jgi:hypothetical protein